VDAPTGVLAPAVDDRWVARVRAADLDRAGEIITASRQNGHGMKALARYGCRHPGQLMEVAAAILRLPRLQVIVSAESHGENLIKRLGRRSFSAMGWYPAESAMVLPVDEATYLRGKARQALRTNVTRAKKDGLRCLRVSDADERKRWTDEIFAARTAPENLAEFMEHYETRGAVGPTDMHVIVDAEDQLVALCEVAVDTETAMVDVFVKMPDHPSAAVARYMMLLDIVSGLIDRGVKVLLVDASRLHVSEGIRYFQRRVGFEPYNVRVRRTR
jgi:hypothetical protein